MISSSTFWSETNLPFSSELVLKNLLYCSLLLPGGGGGGGYRLTYNISPFGNTFYFNKMLFSREGLKVYVF